jgi:sentrin-specific protease 1
MRTLKGNTWLSDPAINVPLNLIKKRSQENEELKEKNLPHDKRLLKIWVQSTFFYENLTGRSSPLPSKLPNKPIPKNKKPIGYYYDHIKTWGSRINIFEYDMVLIPIHLGNHWCMGALNFSAKRIEYYDSLGNSGRDEFYEKMRLYLINEHETKTKKYAPEELPASISNFDVSLTTWTNNDTIDCPKCPKQENGYDCGVFAVRVAEHLSRGAEMTFTQSDMPNYRIQQAYEIATGEMLPYKIFPSNKKSINSKNVEKTINIDSD